MNLLDDIITAITETDDKTSSIMRKCLVLSYRLKNSDLQSWVSKELNGYDSGDPTLPEYRQVPTQAKGLFLGSFGNHINDQPIPPAALKKEHRHFAQNAKLIQPLAAYEAIKPNENLSLPWPPNLTVLYQSAFFEGTMTLNRAWQEIPGSCFVSVIDTIRTRMLTFVLELKQQTSDEEVEVEALPVSTVQTLVQLTVIGGNNVFGDVEKFAAQTVQVGDMGSLNGTLAALGVNHKELAMLQQELAADRQDDPEKDSLGTRTLHWIGRNVEAVGKGAVKISADVAKTVITEAIKRFLGF